jgi:predicted permease
VAALLFGLVPAVRLPRRDVATSLKQFALGGNPPRLGAGRILMAVQVAISVPLLVGAMLFLRTIHNLERVQLGFDPQRLILFRIDPTLNRYPPDRVERVYADVLRKVEAIPGVTSASVVQEVLLSGWSSNSYVTVGDSERKNMYFNRVGPRYFETMGVPIVAGRAIGIQDHSKAPAVAVINETAVRVVFDGAWPIGRHIRSGSDELEVIGIAKDSKYDSLRKAVEPTMFLPYAQNRAVILRPLHVVARTAIEPESLANALRAAVAEVDPSVPVTAMKTQQAQIVESLGAELAFTRLLLVFGLFALFLASIGLHGVTAYSVARRTSEIGVRMALGAQRRDVLWLVLRQVVIIMIAGLIVGVPAALAATRLVSAFLFGVPPSDPASIVSASLILLLVALAAGFLPARRASRLDPLVALRDE